MTAPDTLSGTPSVLPSYLRALLGALTSRGRNFAPGDAVPQSTVTRTGLSLVNERLQRYCAVCGFSGGRIPPTWPQVLAFPLHMRLMTAPGFPIPLPGLVHVRNEIRVRQPLPVDVRVDLVARTGASREVESGTEFDLEADLVDRGDVIWSARATTLYKQRASARRRPRRQDGADFTHEHTRDVAANIGRRYARVSGDYNPIHLFAATARMLGFKRAIAHGMWTLATSLAEVDEPYADRPRRIECAFKTPVLLPGDVRLRWRRAADDCRFRLEDAARERPHIEGSITPD